MQDRLLLVDDDEWIRDSLSIYFETEDYRISAHDTAEKALVELERRKFDVVITDYRLPGMDDIVFLEKIKVSVSLGNCWSYLWIIEFSN